MQRLGKVRFVKTLLSQSPIRCVRGVGAARRQRGIDGAERCRSGDCETGESEATERWRRPCETGGIAVCEEKRGGRRKGKM